MMGAMQVDMGGGNRRQMLQVTVLDQIAGGSQVIERRLHIARIPGGNDIEEKAQAGCAVELTGKIAIGEDAALPISNIASQAMDCLSLIEHAPDPASMGFV